MTAVAGRSVIPWVAGRLLVFADFRLAMPRCRGESSSSLLYSRCPAPAYLKRGGEMCG
jgi:hypothetical protein